MRKKGFIEKQKCCQSYFNNPLIYRLQFEALVVYSLLRIKASEENFASIGIHKKVSKLYVGIGCRVESQKEGTPLFTTINPMDFTQPTQDFDDFDQGTTDSSICFPILGCCVDKNLQPKHLYPERTSDSLAECFQPEVFFGNKSNIVRVQTYSVPVRCFSEQPVNNEWIGNYVLNESGIADLYKMRENFEKWSIQMNACFDQLIEKGGEGRMEVTYYVEEIENADIKKMITDNMIHAVQMFEPSIRSYDITDRLEIIRILVKALNYKLENYWCTLMIQQPHIDLFGDFWDIWNDVTTFTATFWNGRYISSRPFLANLQKEICRPILIPSVNQCSDSREKKISASYKSFMRSLDIDEIVTVPDHMMSIKPVRINCHKKRPVFKLNHDLVACLNCRFLFLQDKMKQNKSAHPCQHTSEYVLIDSDIFWETHLELISKLDELQYQLFHASLQVAHFCIIGCPGTGKTFLAKLVIENLVILFGHRHVAPFSYTNDKADLIGGKTFHSLFGFNMYTDFTNFISNDEYIKNHVKFLFDRSRDKYDNLLTIKYLVGDECSQLSAEAFEAGSRVAKYIRNQSELPFGGIRVILFGDFSQCSPINGQLIFHNEEFRNFFLVRHLLNYHRTTCEMTMKILNSLRAGESNASVLNNLNNNFGKNIALGNALFILDLILERLLIDFNSEGNKPKFLEKCRSYYNLSRKFWGGDIIIKHSIKGYIISPNAKIKLIKRMEQICCDTLTEYNSNSSFFGNFPTTLCAENVEVDFLNEEINARGLNSTVDYHHIRIPINDEKLVVRTFFLQQQVVAVINNIYHLGVISSIESDKKRSVSSIVVTFDNGEKFKFTDDILTELYPYNYYMSNKLTSEEIEEDDEIVVFKRKFQNVTEVVRLRKGQRYLIILYKILIFNIIYTKLYRLLSRSNCWENPFINKATKLRFIEKRENKIVLQVSDHGRKTLPFDVEIDYLFKKISDDGGNVGIRLLSGYAATIDYFQGHEVIIKKG
jgi:hypothetical protein